MQDETTQENMKKKPAKAGLCQSGPRHAITHYLLKDDSNRGRPAAASSCQQTAQPARVQPFGASAAVKGRVRVIFRPGALALPPQKL
jgi:hypothetical protein